MEESCSSRPRCVTQTLHQLKQVFCKTLHSSARLQELEISCGLHIIIINGGDTSLGFGSLELEEPVVILEISTMQSTVVLVCMQGERRDTVKVLGGGGTDSGRD